MGKRQKKYNDKITDTQKVLREKAKQQRKHRVVKEFKKYVRYEVIAISVFILSIVVNNYYFVTEQERLYKEIDNCSVYKGEILGYNRDTWGRRHLNHSKYIYFKPNCPEEIIIETDNTSGSDGSTTAGHKLFGDGVIKLQLTGEKAEEFEKYYYNTGRKQIENSEDIITFYKGGKLLKGVGEVEDFYYYEGVWALDKKDLIFFISTGSAVGLTVNIFSMFSFLMIFFWFLVIVVFIDRNEMDLDFKTSKAI